MTITLPAVLAELDAIARDFGYPVDWAAMKEIENER